ncbi:MAG: tripartite tricarboxylate transporter substrate binding protein [Pseudomonadota bacterium]
MSIRIPSPTRRAGLLLGALALASGAALAQGSYPNHPITLVVPYPPGGSNDVFARAVGKRLGDALGQPVVIDNRPGAGGSLGASMVAKAPADGYTLVAVSSSYVTNAAVQAKMPFDPVKSLVGVAPMARGPFLVAVRQDLPVKTPADLVALAKKQPGKLNYASSGPGSTNQFATELLKSSAGIFVTHIPYRGMAPATTDLMAGTVDMLIASGPSLQPALRSGKARAIAVTSLQPSSIAPDLPPMAGSAPGYKFELWWGILAPAGIPEAILQKLNAEIGKVVSTPEMKDYFLKEGAEPFVATQAAFAKQVRDEIPYWQKIAKQSGINAE